LLISEVNGKSLHFRFSYAMMWALLCLMFFSTAGLSYIIWEMLENTRTAELMEENLLLRSQLQDFSMDVVELERQIELLQMYAIQADSNNTGPWSTEVWKITENGDKSEQLMNRIALTRQKAQLLYPTILQQAEETETENSQFSAIPKEWPLKGYLTSSFGYRFSPFTGKRSFHAGIDVAAPYYTTVFAPSNGTIILAQNKGGYGNTVEIDHGFGVVTRYGHNARLLVKVGERVNKGDAIAQVGSTGRSTGPHLHYEIRIDGVAVDPLKYIVEDGP
jgi:murein DD-endopeptidase MepM/ murein hydrolase activator NlpD